MPIPAPYLLGLQMYEIDDEALALYTSQIFYTLMLKHGFLLKK